MNDPSLACNYALLRFRPYADGAEFVNVGLALWCEALRTFRFYCDLRCADRVQAFFPFLNMRDFDLAIAGMAEEMKRVKSKTTAQPEHAHRAYQELVRQREGLLTFGPNGIVLGESLESIEQRLIERHLWTGSPSEEQHAPAGHTL